MSRISYPHGQSIAPNGMRLPHHHCSGVAHTEGTVYTVLCAGRDNTPCIRSPWVGPSLPACDDVLNLSVATSHLHLDNLIRYDILPCVVSGY